ncbi:MAG: cyclic pyranopterin monophosphate synthase MoaC [Planctomycetota bacterium]
MNDPEPPDPSASADLSHIESDAAGEQRSRMVDVGRKAPTRRTARARALVEFPAGVLEGLLAGGGPKGPIEEVARVAGILAAKRTDELVPMCHTLPLDAVEIRFEARDDRVLEVACTASCTGPTGVEMEAMVGASVAALTVYDMTKAVSKGIRLGAVELVEKTGGKSGTWRRGDG